MVQILICDDDASYREILTFKIEKLLRETLQVEAQVIGVETLDQVRAQLGNGADILFLDVMLRQENTVDYLMQNQHLLHGVPCVLMTAFPVETYNLSEVDCCYYLIKSRMTDEQLLRALKRALNQLTKKEQDFEIVRVGSANYTVNFQDLLYAETFNNNLMLHMLDGKQMTIYSTLKKFTQTLPPNFLRCHKSFMVNMNHIGGFEPHCFTLRTGEKIPIPPKKYAEVVQAYRNYMLRF